MSLRILIVDDSAPMRRLLRRFLEAVGEDCLIEAVDAAEALALYRPEGFDLVLLDLFLPDRDGAEVLREIRLKDSDVAIVVISSAADNATIQRIRQEGANEYLVKPFGAEAGERLLEICRALTSNEPIGPSSVAIAHGGPTSNR